MKKKRKKNLRSSNFSTPGRCLGVRGGARARSRAFPEKGLKCVPGTISQFFNHAD